MREWFLVGLLVAVVCLTLGAESARACSPPPPPPPESPVGDEEDPVQEARARIRLADGAFVGRLVKVRPVPPRREADFIYRVEAVYKGKRRLRRGRLVTVRSSRDGAACGLGGGVGSRYGLLLYRRKGEPRWSSGLCSIMSPRNMRLGARAGEASAGAAGNISPPCA